jgi:predicted nucleotidyltransferase
MSSFNKFIEELKNWASHNLNITAIGLVGSHASGKEKPDSDIDLIILCTDPDIFINSIEWIAQFGAYKERKLEDWGAIKAVRVYFDFSEVEFNFGTPSWANSNPLDEGTRKVVQGGLQAIYDPDKILSPLSKAL